MVKLLVILAIGMLIVGWFYNEPPDNGKHKKGK